MGYSIEIKRSAAKELERMPSSVRARVVDAIDALADSPDQGGFLKGDLSGLRRLRVGDYRVIYATDEAASSVIVLRVRHRREAYR